MREDPDLRRAVSKPGVHSVESGYAPYDRACSLYRPGDPMLSALIAAAGLVVSPSPPPVTGRVLDPNGNPARATVRVYAAETARDAAARQAAGRPRAALSTTETAEDGTFRVAAAPPSVVEASASGYLPHAVVAGAAALTLELHPETTTRGFVRGPAGPVAGVIVAWTGGDVELLATTA